MELLWYLLLLLATLGIFYLLFCLALKGKVVSPMLLAFVLTMLIGIALANSVTYSNCKSIGFEIPFPKTQVNILSCTQARTLILKIVAITSILIIGILIMQGILDNL